MEDVDNEDNNSIAEYRKAMVLNQLNQRPANDDLR